MRQLKYEYISGAPRAVRHLHLHQYHTPGIAYTYVGYIAYPSSPRYVPARVARCCHRHVFATLVPLSL